MNEYWIVTDNRTGKVISHCGDINDAMMMVNFDPHYRSYSRHRFILDQVIDVSSTTDKQLSGQLGLPFGEVNALDPHKIRLPDNHQTPFVV
jgi:hypothetical protein